MGGGDRGAQGWGVRGHHHRPLINLALDTYKHGGFGDGYFNRKWQHPTSLLTEIPSVSSGSAMLGPSVHMIYNGPAQPLELDGASRQSIDCCKGRGRILERCHLLHFHSSSHGALCLCFLNDIWCVWVL